MRLMISFAALFLSIVLLQISTGGLGPLDALSGFALNFSSAEIGLLGSAHFFGFFIGCWYAPRVMGAVGHSRAFAAFAAAGVIGLIAHMLIINPYAWALMRIASGLCIAGCYTVLESWLQAKVTNETRGRAMGTYRVVDNLAALIAQLLISFLEPADYVSYNFLALVCCASLLPLTLTKIKPPETPKALKLRPKLALFRSPLAVAGVLVAAVSAAAFRMVGPIYGAQVGLEVEQIAYFLSAYVFGGALAQYPIGWFADKYDRRWVLIWLSIAAIASSLISTSMSDNNTLAIFLIAFGFGLLHGLGFANVLTGIGIANDQLVMSLLFFNIGIEAGQLLLIPVFSLLIWMSFKIKQNPRFATASSYFLGGIGFYWFIERMAGIIY